MQFVLSFADNVHQMVPGDHSHCLQLRQVHASSHCDGSTGRAFLLFVVLDSRLQENQMEILYERFGDVAKGGAEVLQECITAAVHKQIPRQHQDIKWF